MLLSNTNDKHTSFGKKRICLQIIYSLVIYISPSSNAREKKNYSTTSVAKCYGHLCLSDTNKLTYY